MELWHGSQKIIEAPQFGLGKVHNDYGQGFYCTESLDLARGGRAREMPMVLQIDTNSIWQTSRCSTCYRRIIQFCTG